MNPSRITVLCDEECDRALFRRFQLVSEFLGAIPESNIELLPIRGSIHPNSRNRVNVLLRDDRPDFIFSIDGIPVLVVEMTKHGYTGDNPLQRFSRLAIAAEGGCAVAYFTPFSRVRDDEIDSASNRQPSRRRVNTDVFKGMSRLAEIFGVPMFAVDWPTAANGLPRNLSPSQSNKHITQIAGELITIVERILGECGQDLARGLSVIGNSLVSAELQKVRELWTVPNTRPSAVKIDLSRGELERFLANPSTILSRISVSDYFYKDKPERILLLECIRRAEIEAVYSNSGTFARREGLGKVTGLIGSEESFQTSKLYQSGYKWRSDPHCGVLVNLDYNYCRSLSGRTTRDRDKALILFWPRVYTNENSSAYRGVMASLLALSNQSQSSLDTLFLERYGSASMAKRYKEQLLRGVGDLIGIWRDSTKQARIFKHYCDLIVLGDAIIVGEGRDL